MSPMTRRNPDARYVVAVADKVSPTGLKPLTDDDRFEVVLAHALEGEELEAVLGRAQALIVRSRTQVDTALLDRMPRLEAVGRAGVGVDNIDLEAATQRGIPVMNAPAGNTVSAAELAFALLMASARKVVAADRSLRSGEWSRSAFSGVELRNKTLGLVGAGRIGGEVARRARAFGMRVVAFDPYLTEERAEEIGVTPGSLEEVLEQADFLTLHVPLTSSTRGMIGAEELARMKEGAILLNVARGGVVDEEALAEALNEGHLGGAALDVFAQEPLPEDSLLRDAPNLILTPHLGASTSEAQELVAVEIAAAIRDALLEGDLTKALNAPAIGGEELRRMRPLLELARKVGTLSCVLVPGSFDEVDICVYSHDDLSTLRPVAAAVLTGVMGYVLGVEEVNFVNAHHLAENRGVRIRTSHSSPRHELPQVLVVTLEGEGGVRVRVEGALLGSTHPRIVAIDDYQVNLPPQGSVIVLKNRDVPGVIGRVGTFLGEHGLNIAEYHQSRLAAGGDALAAIAVDGQVSHDLMEALRELPEVTDARLAELS